ncbi:hypothetical protein HGRIS_007465 [Hohenbuehelia grisea]|uniref:HMG box domain-containing protein n=1 Tax=Hohenbuehelia grisea TaxID=104357 RepID=A0ABR3J5A8_9AGAR
MTFTDAKRVDLPVPLSPESPLHSPPTSPETVHRPGAKKGEPGYIPRPKNSFIIFRSDVRKGRFGEDVITQQDVSINAAKMWKALTDEQKKPYERQAALEKARHEQLYPGYKFEPKRKGKDDKGKASAKSPSKKKSKWTPWNQRRQQAGAQPEEANSDAALLNTYKPSAVAAHELAAEPAFPAAITLPSASLQLGVAPNDVFDDNVPQAPTEDFSQADLAPIQSLADSLPSLASVATDHQSEVAPDFSIPSNDVITATPPSDLTAFGSEPSLFFGCDLSSTLPSFAQDAGDDDGWDALFGPTTGHAQAAIDSGCEGSFNFDVDDFEAFLLRTGQQYY